MEVVRCDTPEEFLNLTTEYRSLYPVQTNVLGSVAASVASKSRTYDAYWWWLVRDATEVVGAAFRTAPFGLQIGPMTADAVSALAGAVARDDDAFPWLAARRDLADAFLAAYMTLSSRGAARAFTRGVSSHLYELEELTLPGVEGSFRWATRDDLDLVADWSCQFELFVDGTAQTSTERGRETLLSRLDSRSIALWIAEGHPVSMAGHASPVDTPTGIVTRVGPVFTPEAFRGRTYAGAVTGHLSAKLLRRGSRVILYADVDYPPSNRVYQKLGFRIVDDVAQMDAGEAPSL